MTAAEKVTTTIQRAVRMDDVPQEKFGAILRRTVTGVLFIALGAFLLRFMAHYFTTKQELSMPLLIGGVSCIAFGAHIASRELVGKSVRSLAEPVRILRQAAKPQEGDDAL
jgi:hypothetical protein